jgi:tRNA pseudouridine55 synthase
MQMINSPTGILLVDKPFGITSHDVVDSVRNIFKIKKIGHTGTLDPAATGLLVVLVGRAATKLSQTLKSDLKTYLIDFEFGYRTDTLDLQGIILEKLNPNDPQLKTTGDQIRSTLETFIGSYEQEVPWYSAVKVKGRKLYEVARKAGTYAPHPDIQPPTKPVTIYRIELISITKPDRNYPHLQMEVDVSSGTYTRALIRDIANKLGLPATQTALRRLKAGQFSLAHAKPLSIISENDIIPLDSGLFEQAGAE